MDYQDMIKALDAKSAALEAAGVPVMKFPVAEHATVIDGKPSVAYEYATVPTSLVYEGMKSGNIGKLLAEFAQQP